MAADRPPERDVPSDAWRERLLALGTVLALAVAVWVVYGRALRAPFIFDDMPGIVENRSIVRLWPPLGDAIAPGPLVGPRYGPTDRRPLVNLSFALTYHFGGLDPAHYRVVNIVLHVLIAALVAAIVRRTLRLPVFGRAVGDAAWPLSFTVALAWAMHPLNTEAVAYATQRTELMAAFFLCAILYAAIRYWTTDDTRARRRWATVAGVSCVAGMASKEVVVVAPAILVVFEWTFFAGGVRDLRRSWPLYASLLPGCFVLFLLTFRGARGVLTDARHTEPPLVWWLTQTKHFFTVYLRLALWPWPLSIHYAPRYLHTVQQAWPWLAAFGVFLATTAVLLWRRRPSGFALGTIALLMAPTMLVRILKVAAAERRAYLALASFTALVIVGGFRALAARSSPRLATRATVAVAATIALVLGGVSVRRLAAYETAVTIWRDAVANQPDDAMSHYNLGEALLDEHRPDEAIPSFEAALAIEPDYGLALDNMGVALQMLGRPDDAIATYERALALDANDAVALNNLGSVLTELGRPHDAIPYLRRALRVRTHDPKSKIRMNLGKALLDVGRGDEGIAHLEEAVRLTPEDAEMHLALANGLVRVGKSERALQAYGLALQLKPEWAEAHNNLGIALLQIGKPEEALAQFEHAVRVKPDYASARYNLGNALLNGGRPREALEHLLAAARLDPADAHARFRAAVAYAGSDQGPAAIAMADEALALANAQDQASLADEITAWIQSYRSPR